nr:MAG TPA: hypothetical protein [Caudoviricetes sp.]
MQFYNLTVQFICVILIHNERVWVEKTVINLQFCRAILQFDGAIYLCYTHPQ